MDKKILEANIIEALGLEAMPDEQKIKMVEMMSTIVQKRLMLRIMDELSETDKDEFEKVLGGKDADLVAAEFIKNKVPSIDEIIQEEIIKIKQEMIEKFGSAQI